MTSREPGDSRETRRLATHAPIYGGSDSASQSIGLRGTAIAVPGSVISKRPLALDARTSDAWSTTSSPQAHNPAIKCERSSPSSVVLTALHSLMAARRSQKPLVRLGWPFPGSPVTLT